MSAKNMDDIAELFKGMKFRKKLLGGVSEMEEAGTASEGIPFCI